MMGLPRSLDQIAVMRPVAGDARAQEHLAEILWRPEVAAGSVNPPLTPLGRNAVQGLAREHAGCHISDQLALLLDPLCGDPVLASTREPEPPPSASMRLAVLRCLKPLAQDTPAELFNLRLGHRCLDVKHRPLLRVGQVELAADAGDPCDASAVAHLQELGQFEHLPL